MTERRRVLGETKDPFAPAELDKKTKAALKKAKAAEKAQAGGLQVRRRRRVRSHERRRDRRRVDRAARG